MKKFIVISLVLFSCSQPPSFYGLPNNNENNNNNSSEPPIDIEQISPLIGNPDVKPTLMRGDSVRITVLNESELSRQVTIDPRGTFDYPWLGIIKATGITPWELQERVKTLLAQDYIVDPQVFVEVMNYAPRKVFVLGGVNKTGEYFLNPGEKITLLQLITLSGGFQSGAKKDSIMIVREGEESGLGKSPDEGSKDDPPVKETKSDKEIIYVSLDKIEKGEMQKDPVLLPGDIIIVPRTSKVCYVWGAVNSTGPMPLPPDEKLTLLKAIVLSGGFNKFAAGHKVQVLRPEGTSNSYKTYTVNVDAIASGKVKDDFEIKSGDIIYVPESLF
ncbi:MAG: polysaccharide export protein [Planctomycetes bacterium]|nr:polysaccharide export protein [Planctomycetota bacterium]